MKKPAFPTAYFVGFMFAILVLILSLVNLFSGTKKISETENRELAQKPELTAKAVGNGSYAQQYQEYFNDQFVFRDSWIKLKTGFDRLLGKVEENGVYIGKSGYLIEKFDRPQQSVVNQTLKAMEKFQKSYKDIHHYVMIVPTASEILKDKLPALALTADQGSYIYQAYQTLTGAGLTTVDVESTFRKNTEQQLYYKTDHHWTTSAAYLAFQKFAELAELDTSALTYEKIPVTDQFQGTLSAKSGCRTGMKEKIDVFLPKKNENTTQEQVSSIVEYTDEQKKTGSFYNTDKLDQKNAYEVFFGGNHGLLKIKTPTTENKRLLVFKDSYANCFLPFLAPYYREIVVVDPRYYYGDIQELMDTEEINEVLYLYSADTFFADTSFAALTEE